MFPSRLECFLALRMLRAKRSEGGASIAALVSIVGIALAVFALVVTLSVRAGFRHEFVSTLVGANAHITVLAEPIDLEDGRQLPVWTNAIQTAKALEDIPTVTAAWPAVRGAVMVQFGAQMSGADVHGLPADSLAHLRLKNERGFWEDFTSGYGAAIGIRLAEQLGVDIGDRITLVSPDGVRTPFGVTPRTETIEIATIFTAERHDIDRTRILLPYAFAQDFFNRTNLADEIQVTTTDPEMVDKTQWLVRDIVGPHARVWTWKDSAAGFLRALEMEDRVMKIILSVLVLVSSMAIVSGLVMLARNKKRAIGILRTLGMPQAGILRIFLLIGLSTGFLGATIGAASGVAFALNIDAVLAWLDNAQAGGVWDPEVRGIYTLPALLQPLDVVFSIGLATILSALAALIPALGAAKLDPVEALRHDD